MTKDFENTVLSLLRSVDKRIDSIDGRVGMIEGRIDRIDGHIDKIDSHIAKLNASYGRLDRKVDLVIDILATHSAKFKEHDELFQEIIAGVIPEMEKRTEHSIKLKNHERRITALEST